MGYKNLLIGSQLTDLYLRLILVTKSSSLTNLYNRDLKNIATMYFTQKHKQFLYPSSRKCLPVRFFEIRQIHAEWKFHSLLQRPLEIVQ